MTAFRDKIATAKSLLLVNPRGLGDVVHSLPLIAMLKQSLPDTAIDVLTSCHSKALFAVVPYVREVFSVPHYPRPKSRWERYRRRLKAALHVRKKNYDAIINLQAIDSTLTAIVLSRAPHKLAIRSMSMPIGTPWFYSDVIDQRWRNQSAHRFLLDSMAAAGFAAENWHLGPTLIDLAGQQLPDGVVAPYFHLSPFTTSLSRQLPADEFRALMLGLLQQYPQHQLLVSCSPAQREIDEIHAMIPQQFADRIRVFAGTLDLAQLTLVVARAEAHIGPDTGSLHLAWLAGAKTVSWYLNHESMLAWVPYGPQHRILLSLCEQVRTGNYRGATDMVPMQNIKATQVLAVLDELLRADLPPREQWPASEQLGFRCIY